MALYVRSLKAEEQARLAEMAQGADPELAQRAQIVLLSSKRVGVHEIGERVSLHPINVRKWIHRFDKQGVKGLLPRHSPGRPPVFTKKQREAIADLAMTDPSALGLGFDVWSLQRLRAQLIARGIVEEVSAETIRQQLLKSGLVFDERRWVTTG
ncbi:MAG: helix-turn-helix domain-containing protein [Anaerolineae bacterium]|jgi:transposase|nr:helix-turn-helix domain-containing protein [Anaerolineae bacterium]